MSSFVILVGILIFGLIEAATPPPPLVNISSANATLGSLGLVGTWNGACIQMGVYNAAGGGSCLPHNQAPIKYRYKVSLSASSRQHQSHPYPL